jgi:hypothetical protein
MQHTREAEVIAKRGKEYRQRLNARNRAWASPATGVFRGRPGATQQAESRRTMSGAML